MATLFQPLLATIGTNGQSTYKFDPFCRDWVNLKNNIGQPISHKTWVNPIPTNLTPFCRNWVDSKNDLGQPISRKTRVNPIPTNLTLFCRNWVDLKNDLGQTISHKTWVNPIPTNLTLFCRNWVDFKMTKKSQPNSYKVNPIPTTKVNPIPTKSTQFLQWIWSQPNSYKCQFQPNSYNQVNPITANRRFISRLWIFNKSYFQESVNLEPLIWISWIAFLQQWSLITITCVNLCFNFWKLFKIYRFILFYQSFYCFSIIINKSK